MVNRYLILNDQSMTPNSQSSQRRGPCGRLSHHVRLLSRATDDDFPGLGGAPCVGRQCVDTAGVIRILEYVLDTPSLVIDTPGWVMDTPE